MTPAEPRAQSPSVALLAEIGCADCSEAGAGLAPHAVAVVGDEVWVLDSFAPFVRIFDLEGTRLREFTASGEGPGELSLPAPFIGGTGDGAMLLYNAAPPRLMHVSATDGALIEAVGVPMRVPMNLAFHAPSATLYVLSFMFGEEHARLDRFDARSGELTTLLTDRARYPAISPGSEELPLEARERFPMAATPAGNLAIGHAWEYRIVVLDADGNELRRLRRDLPRPRADGTGEQTAGTELPHFDPFAIDWDMQHDRLWVRMLHGDLNAETAFDVFESAGGFLARVSIPAATDRVQNLYDVEGDVIATWREDESGSNVLTLWRVDWH